VAQVRLQLGTSNGQTRFIGIDVSGPPLLEDGGKLLDPRPVEGRLLNARDAEKDVIVVGITFAQNNQTGFGHPILGMADHQPPFFG
jgi:hypothetical protein